ncbi:MAG: winged helix-turn-helix domain-containing protein [Pseudomonadota bacterium]
MSHLPDFSTTAFLIADQTRAAMLTMLMDGRALPAGELAYAAGVTAQTASSHLAKLLEGGLIMVEIQGRHRYYRLAGSEVAFALEQLAAIRPTGIIKRKALSPLGRQLQFCRRCYDHLAGEVGVAITQGLQRQGYILPAADKKFEVTSAGVNWFDRIGLDVLAIKPTKYGLARQCLDWTERTHHLAGPLGVQLMNRMCSMDWLHRSKSSRAILVTPIGWAELKEELGLDKSSITSSTKPLQDGC